VAVGRDGRPRRLQRGKKKQGAKKVCSVFWKWTAGNPSCNTKVTIQRRAGSKQSVNPLICRLPTNAREAQKVSRVTSERGVKSSEVALSVQRRREGGVVERAGWSVRSAVWHHALDAVLSLVGRQLVAESVRCYVRLNTQKQHRNRSTLSTGSPLSRRKRIPDFSCRQYVEQMHKLSMNITYER